MAARSPSAIGRSKAEPSLRVSAGARLIVILRLGNSKPELLDRRLHPLERFADRAFGQPDHAKRGTPAPISTSTSTANASTPASALDITLASKNFLRC